METIIVYSETIFNYLRRQEGMKKNKCHPKPESGFLWSANVMAKICRICMEAPDDLLSIAIVKKEGEEIEILKTGIMFEDNFGIEVAELPDYLQICMGCKIQLTYFYDFKQQALKNHKILLNLKESVKKEIDVNEPVLEESEENPELDVIGFDESKIDSLVPDDDREGKAELIFVTEINDEDEANYSLDIEYLEDDLRSFCVMNLEDELAEIKTEHVDDGDTNMPLEISNTQEEDVANTNIEIVHGLDEVNEPQNVKRKKSSNSSCKIQYECEICGKKFRNLEIFSGHLNIHQGLPAYCCDICGKEFKFKVNYDYHMKNHNNTRSFKCSFCTKRCLSKWDLKLHMRTHLDCRPYECEICGKAFRVRSHMTDHMETHNKENNYVCPTCLQKYKTKASLKMHITTVHLKTSQYPCTLCDKVFYRTYHLKIHQKVHMRNVKNS